MALSYDDFLAQWRADGESMDPITVETGWRRVQQIQESTPAPSVDLREAFTPFLSNPNIASKVQEYKFLTIHANRIPWTPTGVVLQEGMRLSCFATGRVWRSRMMGLYLGPQATLCYRVGVNGEYFNSTRDTITFEVDAGAKGELYIASQFPGQFQERTGRVLGELGVFEKKGDGEFEILVIVWSDSADVEGLLKKDGRHPLMQTEIRRPQEEEEARLPEGWEYFWYIGSSTMYRALTPVSDTDGSCIHCKPYNNVGILQKDIDPTITFTPGTKLCWEWKVDRLPSRLREDTTFTHDYLSVAVEFENGRDITYTWSWELPVDYGYWCPLPTWTDREYHVVIRSGTEGLGEWLREERDLYADYERYIGGEGMPERIVKVWLIAGNRWQRLEGEMTVRAIEVAVGGSVVKVELARREETG